MKIELELTEREAKHLVDCLGINSDANGGNDEVVGDGETRTWDRFSEELFTKVRDAAVRARGQRARRQQLLPAAILAIKTIADKRGDEDSMDISALAANALEILRGEERGQG